MEPINKTRVLITGASGFLGQYLISVLGDEYELIGVVRRPEQSISENYVVIRDFHDNKAWLKVLEGIDVVIHCAAKAHSKVENNETTIAEYRQVNTEITKTVSEACLAASVRRILFVSSIKVNGESSSLDTQFTPSDMAQPQDPYAISKYEAEQVIKGVCLSDRLDYCIIRPTLTYGPGVKANFLSMLKWVSLGVPLPLGCIRNNKRSLVYVENLVDLTKACIEHPAAANQTFLVSDDDDVSTRELLVRVASALGVKSRLINIPLAWLGLAGKLLGKKDIEQRLCASLHVDIVHTKNTLNWTPPFSMQEGLRQTAEWYKARN